MRCLMGYRCITRLILGLTALFFALFVVAAAIIDPVNIWGCPVFAGFNNYKEIQFEISKPYEYGRVKPDIFFIGSSRVFVGLSPDFPGEENKKIYNFGAVSLPLKEMREYLRLAYKIHKPQTIYIGLDFFQFGEKYQTAANNFNQRRIDAAAHKLTRCFWQIKDTTETVGSIPKVIEDSRKKPHVPMYYLGYDYEHGEGTQSAITPEQYYGVFNLYNREVYPQWTPTENAYALLEDIKNEADAAGVKAVFFFNPFNVDVQSIIYNTNLHDEFKTVKRRVASITPFYDFAFVSPITAARQNCYRDPNHYLKPVGDKVKAALAAGGDSDISFFVNADNIENILQKENEAYKKWRGENDAYAAALDGYIKSKDELPKGEFKQYWGF